MFSITFTQFKSILFYFFGVIQQGVQIFVRVNPFFKIKNYDTTFRSIVLSITAFPKAINSAHSGEENTISTIFLVSVFVCVRNAL
jgi:hypothetical protein